MASEIEYYNLASLGVPPIQIAQATKSGSLLLLNGLGSFGYANDNVHPLDASHRDMQIQTLFDALDTTLDSPGRSLMRMLATEQRYTSATTVPIYHRHRQAAWAPVPPSTSVLQERLMSAQQATSVDGIAANADLVEYLRVEGIDIPATSGFVPVSRAGSLYCVAGFMAAHGEGDLGGIAPEVRIPEGHQWKGDRVRREVGYIWDHKLLPILQQLQLAPHHISRAAVFYTEPDEAAEVIAAWKGLFGDEPPLTNYICVREQGLAITDAKVEINLLLDAQRIHTPNAPQYTVLPDGTSAYSRFGDHLIYMIYPDALGGPSISIDVHPAEYETHSMAEKLAQSLEQHGAGFGQVARIAQAYLHRRDVLHSCRIWEKYFGENPIPLSASFAPRLPLNNIQSCIEAWVYKPLET